MRWHLLTAFFLLVICIHFVRSEYVEGIDTTDADGYGLDSAFQVTGSNHIEGSVYVSYCFEPQNSSGYYNYTFNEIKKVPDTYFPGYDAYQNAMIGYCFIIEKYTVYSKILVLEQLSDGRFVYRYGTATSPNDLMLVESDYDRSIKYNVNNLFNHQPYCVGGYPYCDPNEKDTLHWEPPLPNDNHLRGYILYVSKSVDMIDTTEPINAAQWDSIAFYTSDTRKSVCRNFPDHCYFNMVAVYDEGNSDFLGNWTYVNESRVNAGKTGSSSVSGPDAFTVRNTESELIINVRRLTGKTGAPKLDLYTLSGRLIASWRIDQNSSAWSISKNLLPSETCVAHFTAATGDRYTRPVFCMH